MSKHHLYRHYDAAGMLLYVGASKDAMKRLRGHQGSSSWYGDITRISIDLYPDKSSCRAAERDAIFSEQPVHNQQHKNRMGSIQARLPVDLINAIRAYADDRGVTPSEVVERTLYAELEKSGHLIPAKNLGKGQVKRGEE